MLRLHSMPTCRKLTAWTMLQARVHRVRSNPHRANIPLLKIHILTTRLHFTKSLFAASVLPATLVIDQRPTLPSYASGREDYGVRDSTPALVPPRRERDSGENHTLPSQPDDKDSAENSTVNAYPRHSSVTATRGSPAGRLSGTGKNTSTRKERDTFVASLPTRVQVKLNQPFGKDNLTQCFKSQVQYTQ